MKKLLIVIILLFALTFSTVIWWNSGLQAPKPGSKFTTIFVVNKGEGVRAIASKLKREGLIKSPIVFFLLTKKLGIDGQIEAGDFRLSPAMTAEEVARQLTHGTLDIWVTIPEGKRADEIADMLREKIPGYKESWRETLDQNEGYLFPDTYLIPRDATADTVVSLMRNNFENKYATLKVGADNTLSKSQVVTLASLIEREARTEKDRPLVASVIINRLTLGMALQLDASIQYTLGYQPSQHSWWKKNLTAEDLKINSPFNTYANTGLPPYPIANPGLSALSAASAPAKTDYLYYLSDKNGINHYARTLSEHNENIRKYGL